jgi:uncharacterized protein with PIN domain
VKFIADGMLGKLTRWLRMLGQDVEYSAQLQDDELVETAKNNHKILLTRDLELHKKGLSKGIESFYIEGNSGAEKLAKLAKRYGFCLEIDMERSRCPKCNTRILATSKEKIEGKIEKNTFNHYDEFWKCPNCDSVYWQGAHWKGILATLEEAKKMESSKI